MSLLLCLYYRQHWKVSSAQVFNFNEKRYLAGKFQIQWTQQELQTQQIQLQMIA